MSTNIAQFGLGPIGVETLKLAANKPWLEIVGAVDNDPAKAGQDLGELTGLAALRGWPIHASLTALVNHAKPDVILHTSVSKLSAAMGQILPMAERGISVVSSSEELVFPQLREPKLADEWNETCKRHGARVIGTGVNPGFVMDLLPLFMTSVCRQVRAVHVERVVDASTRREPLQRKIGSGLPPEEFRDRLQRGEAGHAGLRESLALLAHGLGWRLESVREHSDVVVAGHPIRTNYFIVQKGQTCGIHQRLEATMGSKVCLTLDLKMSLDAKEPHDTVRVEGDPPLHVRVEGGVAGDAATAAALVNTIPRLLQASPGLLLLTDLPLPHFS